MDKKHKVGSCIPHSENSLKIKKINPGFYPGLLSWHYASMAYAIMSWYGELLANISCVPGTFYLSDISRPISKKENTLDTSKKLQGFTNKTCGNQQKNVQRIILTEFLSFDTD